MTFVCGSPPEEPLTGPTLIPHTHGQAGNEANATKRKSCHPTWQLQCSPSSPRVPCLIVRQIKEHNFIKKTYWSCSPKSDHDSCLSYFKFFFQWGTKFHNFGLDPVKELLVIMVQIPQNAAKWIWKKWKENTTTTLWLHGPWLHLWASHFSDGPCSLLFRPWGDCTFHRIT